MTSSIITTALAAAFVSCAAAPAPVPVAQLARAEEGVRAAEALHARTEPRAALHLRLAMDQLDYARRLIARGDFAEARWMLARAEADAEVSANLVRAHFARADAERTLAAATETREARANGRASREE